MHAEPIQLAPNRTAALKRWLQARTPGCFCFSGNGENSSQPRKHSWNTLNRRGPRKCVRSQGSHPD